LPALQIQVLDAWAHQLKVELKVDEQVAPQRKVYLTFQMDKDAIMTN
jgi:hypothetical protein